MRKMNWQSLFMGQVCVVKSTHLFNLNQTSTGQNFSKNESTSKKKIKKIDRASHKIVLSSSWKLAYLLTFMHLVTSMSDSLLSGEVITRALGGTSSRRWSASPQSSPKACDMTKSDMRTSSVLTKTTSKTKDAPWNQTYEASDSSLIALQILLVQAFRCSPVAEGGLKSRILKCHTPEIHVSVETCVSHLVCSFSLIS